MKAYKLFIPLVLCFSMLASFAYGQLLTVSFKTTATSQMEGNSVQLATGVSELSVTGGVIIEEVIVYILVEPGGANPVNVANAVTRDITASTVLPVTIPAGDYTTPTDITINPSTTANPNFFAFQVLGDTRIEPDETIKLTILDPATHFFYSIAAQIYANSDTDLVFTNEIQDFTSISFDVRDNAATDRTEELERRRRRVTVPRSAFTETAGTQAIGVVKMLDHDNGYYKYTVTRTINAPYTFKIKVEHATRGAFANVVVAGTGGGPNTYLVGAQAESTHTLTNDDNPPQNALYVRLEAVQDTVTEGVDSNAEFKVVLYKSDGTPATAADLPMSATAIRVFYSLSGTALGGGARIGATNVPADYTSPHSSDTDINTPRFIDIPSGALEATISLPINDDSTQEDPETIIAEISSAEILPTDNGGVIIDSSNGNNVKTITLISDEIFTDVRIRFSRVSGSTTFENVNPRFKVALFINNRLAQPGDAGLKMNDVTVVYSITGAVDAGTDYTGDAEKSVVLPGGTTSVEFDVDLIDDNTIEPDKVMTLEVIRNDGTDPYALSTTAADLTRDVLIKNDDKLTLSVADATIDETDADKDAPMQITVSGANLTAVTPVAVTITVKDGTAASPTDYSIGNARTIGVGFVFVIPAKDYTVAANQIVDVGTVNIKGNDVFGGNKTFTLEIASPAPPASAMLGAKTTATYTIKDDEVPPYTIKLEKVSTGDVAENPAAGSTTATQARFKAVLYDGATKATTSTIAESVTITYKIEGTTTEGQDYAAIDPKTVTLAMGSLVVPIDIELIDDTIFEENETIKVTLIAVTGSADVSLSTADLVQTITITSDDKLTVSVADADIPEGDATNDASLQIKVSGGDLTGYTAPVTVQLTITDGTAISTGGTPNYTINDDAGATRTSGTAFSFTIPAADYSTEQTLDVASVNIKGNTVYGGDKTFTLTLSNPTPTEVVTLGTSTSATYTIKDDEPEPSYSIRLETVTVGDVAESATSAEARFRAVLYDGATKATASTIQQEVTIGYIFSGTATAGVDYTEPTSKAVILPANAVAVDIIIPLINDNIIEDKETLTLILRTPRSTDANAPATVSSILANAIKTVTITSEDKLTVSVANADIPEGDAPNDASLQIMVSGANLPAVYTTTNPVTVQLTITDGTAISTGGTPNYTINDDAGATRTSGTAFSFTIPAADYSTEQTLEVATVNIKGNTEYGGDKTFTLALSNPTPTEAAILGTSTSATYTIKDDENLTLNVAFAEPATSQDEGNSGTATPTGLSDLTVMGPNLTRAETIYVLIEPTGDNPVSFNYMGELFPNELGDVSLAKLMSVNIPQGNYATTPGTISIPAASLAGVEVIGDTRIEQDETFKMTILDSRFYHFQFVNTFTNADASAQTISTPFTDYEYISFELSDIRNSELTGIKRRRQIKISKADLTSGTFNRTIQIGYDAKASKTASFEYTVTSKVGVEDNKYVFTIRVEHSDQRYGAISNVVVKGTHAITGVNEVSSTQRESSIHTITDDDTPAYTIKLEKVTVGDVAENAADAKAEFKVVLYEGSTAVTNSVLTTDVTVTYAIAGTATVPGDYANVPTKEVVITGGAVEQAFEISINDDTMVEDDETITVTLTGTTPAGAAMISSVAGEKTQTVTIKDDDTPAYTLKLERVSTEMIAENATDAKAEFKAVLYDGATKAMTSTIAQPVTIQYEVTGTATEGQDFNTITTKTVILVANEVAVDIVIPLINDNIVEDNETIIVTLRAVTGSADVSLSTADLEQTITITSDDKLTVSVADTEILETDANKDASLQIMVSGGIVTATDTDPNTYNTNPVTVELTITDGTATSSGGNPQYSFTDGISGTAFTFTIPSGDYTTAMPVNAVTVNIKGDDTYLGDKTFNLAMAIPTNAPNVMLGTPASATYTIKDDEQVPTAYTIKLEKVTVGDVAENAAGSTTATQAQFRAALYDGANKAMTSTITQPVTIQYEVTGTATEGQDFNTITTKTVILAANEEAVDIVIPLINDNIVEDNETIIVTLRAVTGSADVSLSTADLEQTITITSDDKLTVSVTDAEILETDANKDTSLQIMVSGGIVTATDTDPNTYNTNPVTVELTITDGTATSSGGNPQYSFTDGISGTAFTFTIPSGDYSTAMPVNAVTVNIKGDDTYLGDKTFNLAMAIPTNAPNVMLGTPASATYTIKDDEQIPTAYTIKLEKVTVGDVAENPAAGSTTATQAQFRVVLYDGANKAMTSTIAQPVTIQYAVTGTATEGQDFNTITTKTVILAANEEAVDIVIPLINDNIVEDNETIIVTLRAVTGSADVSLSTADLEQTITITSDDRLTVSVTDAEILETDANKDASLQIMVSGGIVTATDTDPNTYNTNPVTVELTITDGTAASSGDNPQYSFTDGMSGTAFTFTIPSGDYTTAMPVNAVTVNIKGDDTYLGDKTFNLAMAIPTNAPNVMLGTPASATYTIKEDEQIPTGYTIKLEKVSTGDVAENPAAGSTTATQAQFRAALYDGANKAMTSTITQPVTIQYEVTGTATEGQDFNTITTKTVILVANEVAVDIVIPLINDNIVEDNETIIVTLKAVTGSADVSLSTADLEQTITITSDDKLTVSVTDAEILETDANKDTSLQIMVSGGIVTPTDTDPNTYNTNPVTVELTITDGTATSSGGNPQYSFTDGMSGTAFTFTIPSGDYTTAMPVNAVTVNIKGDDTYLGDKTFNLAMAIPTNAPNVMLGTPAIATYTIKDDEQVPTAYTIKLEKVTVGDVAEKPAAGSTTATQAQFRAVLYDGATKAMTSTIAQPVTIKYAVRGTATEGQDFNTITTKTVILAANAIEVAIEIPLIDDTLVEENETIIVTLTEPLATDTTAPAKISATATDNTQTVTITSEDVTPTPTYSIHLTRVGTGSVAENSGTALQFKVALHDAAGAALTVAPTGLSAITVSYELSGSATEGADYTAITTQEVVIAMGSFEQTFDITLTDDTMVEDDETIVVTLTGPTTAGAPMISSVAAEKTQTVTITSEDVAPAYTIKLEKVTTGTVDESTPGAKAEFKVVLYEGSTAVTNSVLTTDVTVTYALTNSTATETAATVPGDYANVPTKEVVIRGGAVEQAFEISINDDMLIEDDETITVTLTGPTTGSPMIMGTPAENTQTVTITSDDKLTVSVADAEILETDANKDASLQIMVSGGIVTPTDTDPNTYNTNPVTVELTISDGTAASSGDNPQYSFTDGMSGTAFTFTIPSGDYTTAVPVNAVTVNIKGDDTYLGDKTFNLAMAIPTNAPNVMLGTPESATYTIKEDEHVPTAYTLKLERTSTEMVAENATNAKAQFKVVLYEGAIKATTSTLATPITVTYAIAGTATESTATVPGDYEAIATKEVILDANALETPIDITLVDDMFFEEDKTIIVTLAAVTGSTDVALSTADTMQTVTITNDDILTVAVADQSVVEPSVDANTPVNLLVTGAVLPAGTTVTVDFTITDGTALSTGDTPDYTINGETAGTTRASGDVITLTIEPKDYTVTANQNVLAAEVNIKTNNTKDGDKSFGIALSNPSPAVLKLGTSSAVFRILDDEVDLVVKLERVTTDGIVSEAVSDVKAQFKVMLYTKTDPPVATNAPSDIVVNYMLSGTATAGQDYTEPATKQITIASGNGGGALDIAIINDTLYEENETIIVKLVSVEGVEAGLSATATDLEQSVTITSEDVKSFVIKLDNTAVTEVNEGTADAKAQFIVALYNGNEKAKAGDTGLPTSDITVTYEISATTTASDNQDYRVPTENTVTIPQDSYEVALDILILNDNIIEANEFITVKLTGITPAGTSLSSLASDIEKSVTIVSDDKLTVSVENQNSIEGDAAEKDGSIKIKVTGADLTGYAASAVTVMVTITDGSDATTGAMSPTHYAIKADGDGNTRTSGTPFTVTIPAIDYTNATNQELEVAMITIKGNTVEDVSRTFTIGVSSSSPEIMTLQTSPVTATYTINNDDSDLYAKLEKVTPDTGVSEAETNANAQFKVKLYKKTDNTVAATTDVTTDITVDYTLAGTAVAGEDYTEPAPKQITITSGTVEQALDIALINDTMPETNETVVVKLTNIVGTGVGMSIVDADLEKSVTIISDDKISITLEDQSNAEGNSGTTTPIYVKVTGADVTSYNGDITIMLTITDDTATSTGTDADYTFASGLSGTAFPFTIPKADYTIEANQKVIVTTVAIHGETTAEEDETIQLLLSDLSPENMQIAEILTKTATYTITNDDGARVTGLPQDWLTDSKQEYSMPSQILSLSGENNELQIAGLSSENSVSIYNRVGVLVWSTDNYPQGRRLYNHDNNYFKGVSNVYNGKLPTGTYFMTIENHLSKDKQVTSHTIVIVE